jgi:hypothetical protein
VRNDEGRCNGDDEGSSFYLVFETTTTTMMMMSVRLSAVRPTLSFRVFEFFEMKDEYDR